MAPAKNDELPEPYNGLVEAIRANNPESGGEFRRANAELQARLILAQDRTARRLTLATWALVIATLGLLVVTFLAV